MGAPRVGSAPWALVRRPALHGLPDSISTQVNIDLQNWASIVYVVL